MFSASVVKTIDILKEGVANPLSCVPSVPPDQFGFEGFKEGLDGSIVITIAFATHPLPGRQYPVSTRGDTLKPTSRNRF